MTRSILMYERPYHDEKGQRYLLQYYLLIDEVSFGCNSLEIYGAKAFAFSRRHTVGPKGHSRPDSIRSQNYLYFKLSGRRFDPSKGDGAYGF